MRHGWWRRCISRRLLYGDYYQPHNEFGLLLSFMLNVTCSLHQEPPRPPSPEPTVFTYTRLFHQGQSPSIGGPSSDFPYLNWTHLEIRLVGSHPLWGHYLYVVHTFISYTLFLTPFERKLERSQIYICLLRHKPKLICQPLCPWTRGWGRTAGHSHSFERS